jgi:hypothetical protein
MADEKQARNRSGDQPASEDTTAQPADSGGQTFNLVTPSSNPEGAGESGVPVALGGVSSVPVQENSGDTAEAAASSVDDHRTGERPWVTRAEGEVPGTESHTAPGDAPADTTDPRERLSTATPSGSELAKAAQAGLGSVVAYAKVGESAPVPSVEGGRIERYQVPVDQFGNTVTVEHNIDTGKSRRV